MKFVSSATSSNPDYNAEFDYAFLDVTAERARRILSRYDLFMKAHGKDQDLFEMYFWDSLPDYFSTSSATEEWFHDRDENPPEGEVFALDDQQATPKDLKFLSYECGQMILCEKGVRWTCIPKHSSIYITTETIKITQIKEML